MKTIAFFKNENYQVLLVKNEETKLYTLSVYSRKKLSFEPITKGEFKNIIYAKETFKNLILEIFENN